MMSIVRWALLLTGVLLAVAVLAQDTAAPSRLGTLVMPCNYDDVYSFSDGLALVERNDQWGYVNTTGREVIPCKYLISCMCFGLTEHLACLCADGRFGFLDKTGQTVIPFQYTEAAPFAEGLAVVRQGDKWGFIDKAGQSVVPVHYDFALPFSEGLAAVKLGKCWGFIDTTGREVIPLKYEDADAFHGGLAAVRLNHQWGFIDKTGNEIIACKYHLYESFAEGIAGVLTGNRLGFIDRTGQEIVPSPVRILVSQWLFRRGHGGRMPARQMGVHQYRGARSHSINLYGRRQLQEGLARVQLNGAWGYIDKTGQLVIPLRYAKALSFSEGLAGVQVNGKWGFIDKTGREVIVPTYEDVLAFPADWPASSLMANGDLSASSHRPTFAQAPSGPVGSSSPRIVSMGMCPK